MAIFLYQFMKIKGCAIKLYKPLGKYANRPGYECPKPQHGSSVAVIKKTKQALLSWRGNVKAKQGYHPRRQTITARYSARHILGYRGRQNSYE